MDIWTLFTSGKTANPRTVDGALSKGSSTYIDDSYDVILCNVLLDTSKTLQSFPGIVKIEIV